MLEYLKSASDDPLFTRVVMGIWALPFIALSVFIALHVPELCQDDYWILVFPLAIGALGVFLMYTAVLADDKTVEKRTEFVHDGADLIGVLLIVAVIILAIPIWEFLKLLRAED